MSHLDMRGLNMFIADIRNCRTKDQEIKRINKEMAKIRQKFKQSTSMTGYDRKKYVAKLLYMYMLGYNIDFGHIEAVNLLSSDIYSEKHLGYLACSLLLDETAELLTLIINSVARDLMSSNELFQCLALTAIANVGNKQFAEALSGEVIKVLVERDTKTVVMKKAALTLLRLYRKYPEILPPDSWSPKVCHLLDRPDLGVVTSVASLLVGLASDNPDSYKDSLSRAIRCLSKIVLQKEFTNDYVYYGVPTPWLQVKLLRLLQYFPPPAESNLASRLDEVLARIVSGTEVVKNPNKNNAIHAILFEAINLAIAHNTNSELLGQSVTLLGRYLGSKDSNLKYLSLECLARVAGHEALKKQQDVIIASLKDADISIRRRALEVLYCLCDHTNSDSIVKELLDYLQVADFAIREDLVLRTALLAEKFAHDYRGYFDTVMRLVSYAGDFVTEDVWFRVVQIVTNQPSLQRYAAETVLKEVRSSGAHEICVKLAAFILGEFGRSVSGVTSLEIFDTLHAKFPVVSRETQNLLLTAYAKLLVAQPNDQQLRDRVMKVYNSFQSSMDAEMQQRAFEYLHLRGSLGDACFEKMPAFPERESSVLRKLKARQEDVTDKSVWQKKEEASAGVGPAATAPAPAEPTPSAAPRKVSTASAPPQEVDLLGGSPSAPAGGPSRAGDDILDLLSGPASAPVNIPSASAAAVTVAAPASKPAPAAAPAASGLDDLFGLGPSPSSSGGASGAAVGAGLPPGTSADGIQTLYRSLCLQEGGVLYEDNSLQIVLKQEYMNAEGRIGLFFTNKSGSPVARLSCLPVNSSEIGVTMQVVNNLPLMIPPRQQAQMMIAVRCTAPFEGSPVMNLAYDSYQLQLKIPIIISKFNMPATISGEQFMGAWRNFTAEGTERMEVFKTTNLGAAPRVVAGMRLNILQGLDPNPTNIVAAASCCSSPVLLRLEANAAQGMFRMTIRTPLPRLTAVMFATLRSFLE